MLTNESDEARLNTLERQMKRLLEDRSIRSALDGSFANKWPSRIMGPEGDAYIIVRQPGGVLSSVPISEYSADDWTDGAYYSEIAIGTIWQYAGSEDDIPSTWQLCDGTNGTPDLRDKFLLGGEFSEIGTEAAEQALVIDNHSSQTLTIGNHVDDVTSANGSNTSDTVTDDGTNQKSVLTGHTSHLISLNLSHAGSSVSAPSAHVVSTPYYPPYYKLAFIMKVA